MKRTLRILLVLLIVSTACQNLQNKKKSSINSNESQKNSSEYKTRSGKFFIVDVDHSIGASICNVQIETRGFLSVNSVHKLGTIDPVESIFLADLDMNGFEEIYIATRSTGSGSYSNIYGFASNKDKSISEIYVRENSELIEQKAAMFEGFMGHNTFKVEKGKLVNVFPVYKEGDSNAKPTEGKRSVEYELIAGEASWILAARSIVD